MNNEQSLHPMGKAAIAYAVFTLLGLLLVNILEAPLAFYSVSTPKAILLGKSVEQSLYAGGVIGIFIALSGEFFTRYILWGKVLARTLRRFVRGLHRGDVFFLALLSAAGEELLFRGVIMPYTGVILSSVIFGLMHFVPRKHLWPWSLWAGVAGYCFGYLAEQTGGILAPMTAHFVVNLIGLWKLSR